MKKLDYRITINAPQEKIWEVLRSKETYSKRTKPFSENSICIWVIKEWWNLDFLDKWQWGTRVIIKELKVPELIRMEHISVLGMDWNPVPEDQQDKDRNWTLETYILEKSWDQTIVTVEIETTEKYWDTNDDSMPKALEILKQLSE